MPKNQLKWITCQLGAREHYAIPRALHKAGELHALFTDVWVSPHSSLNIIRHPILNAFQERFHPELLDAPIRDYTAQLLVFEVQHRFCQTEPWMRIIYRNAWFQNLTCKMLKGLSPKLQNCDRPILFAYSYAALELLQFAKEQGWYSILGQIDPGTIEANIVRQEHERHPDLAPQVSEPPLSYWSQWQEECHLADQILVNSSWSKQALATLDIPASKLNVVPLAYEPTGQSETFQRTYPDRFTNDRPLRVLFLGQVILRKGIAALIDAAQKLRDCPIEFWMIGPIGINLPQQSNLNWIGLVPRSLVSHYYQQADIFLFPTLSDGFGLTQLEAQAWKLPIIASQNCGEVVQNQVNGYTLLEVSGDAIASALITCLKNPEQLQKLSLASGLDDKYSLDRLYHNLQSIIHAPI